MLLDKLAVACILIIKETNAFDKDQWSVAKLIDVKDSPPYFLLVLGCIVGSALELFLLGPPAMQRAQSWCLAKRAKQTYRFYLLLAFFYGANTDISATIAFARDDLLSSDKSTVNIVMDISECLILKMATGSNADDAIKKFVLCPLDTLFVSTQLLFSIFWHATRIDEDKPRSNAQAFHCQWPNFHNLVVLGHSVPVCLPHDSRGCHFSNGAYLLLGGHSAFCSLQSYGMAGMDLDPNFCVESCAWRILCSEPRGAGLQRTPCLWLRQAALVQILTLIILSIPQPCFDLWLDTDLQDHGNTLGIGMFGMCGYWSTPKCLILHSEHFCWRLLVFNSHFPSLCR